MKDYYPIEVFHWAGMKDENIFELVDILNKYPEYVHEKNSFGDNCLFIAIKAGNFNMVRYLIEKTLIDINHIGDDGNALMIAIEHNRNDMIDYLLSKKIKMNVKNKLGQNIYHVAAKKGNSDLIEKFLELNVEGLSIQDLDKNNQHCLFNVIENYSMHKNYWCFDLIQDLYSKKLLETKNVYQRNILDEAIEKQEDLKNKFPKMPDLANRFDPIINVLQSRLE
jgi:predicted DNA-binding protein